MHRITKNLSIAVLMVLLLGSCQHGEENGADCTEDRGCKSGHCVDGICCATECSGENMSCLAPEKRGQCVCKDNFSGDNCDQCLSGYFGPQCAEKVLCQNGQANDGINGDGHCKSCNDDWSGPDCDLAKTCQHGIAKTGVTGDGNCEKCDEGWLGPGCTVENKCQHGTVN